MMLYAGCGSGSSNSHSSHGNPVTISPKTANVFTMSQNASCGCGQQQFQAFIQGSSTTMVNWLVNGIQGGSSSVGIISSTGLYVPPDEVPSGGSVTVTAQSVADTSQTDSATVSLQYPSTAVRSVTPRTVQEASAPTTVTLISVDQNVSRNATVYLNGTQIASSWISNQWLTVTVPSNWFVAPATLRFGIKNPAPGGGGTDGTGANDTPLYVVEGQYVEVGDSVAVRTQAAGALLPSGKVLITGGKTQAFFADSLDSTEIFDPQTNTFQLAGTMTSPRSSHFAIALNTGMVFIAGGQPNPTTAELYDPATGTFTATPPMNFPHYKDPYNHPDSTAILLNNGQVLLEDWIEGPAGMLQSEVYDPASNIYTVVPTGANTCTFPEKCCLGGGILASKNLTADALYQYFDPGTLTFTNASQSGAGAGYSSCVVAVLPNQQVFSTNGVSPMSPPPQGSIWDPVADATTTFPMLSVPSASAPLPDGHLLTLGGFMDEIIDPKLGQAFVGPQALMTRADSPTVVVLTDGRVLVVGGEGGPYPAGFLVTATAETYVPQGQSQSKQKERPPQR
jgi:hypothetical protein